MAELPASSAQQRLAASRRALLDAMDGPRARTRADEASVPIAAPTAPRAASSTSPWPAVARRVVRRWWYRHPVHAVGLLAEPALARCAREQPAKLMLASAATGALLVVVRPWRLLSATALLAAVFRTSDVADMVTTLMHAKSTPRKEKP